MRRKHSLEMEPAIQGHRGALLLLAVGCGGRQDSSSTAIARDSGGIQIVESSAPARTAAPWILDTVPSVDLGGPAGGPNQEFSGSLVPVRQANGRIVVAAGGSNDLRLFRADGTWERTVGRAGSGPGEFRQLGWLGLGPGDTLWTYDFDLRRVSVFSGAGEFVRPITVQPAGELLAPSPFGLLPDGRLLTRSGTFATEHSKPGLNRDVVPIHIYDSSGVAPLLVARFPGGENVIETGKGSVSVSGLPFGKALSLAVDGDRLYVGTGDRPEVLVVDLTGAVRRVIRWTGLTEAVTPADIEAYIAHFGEAWPPGQEAMRDKFLQMMRRAPFPKSKPAYAGLLTGPGRSLWVRRYSEPDREAPAEFAVFDSTGVWLGKVSMPARFEPAQIGSTFVLGKWTDPDDVAHIRLYGLKATPR